MNTLSNPTSSLSETTGETLTVSRRPLPHEIFFGLALATLWGRLVHATGLFGAYSLFYLGLVALNIGAVVLPRLRETPLRWRLGLGFYPVAMNLVYFSLKEVIPLLDSRRRDGALHRIDSRLIGTNLSVRLQPFIHPALTEVLSLCYLLFFPYLVVSTILFFAGDLTMLKRFVTGLFSIYGIGFLGYSLVPAAGPYAFLANQFTRPLNGWWLTRVNAEIVARGSNGVDVFPSLHCAITFFLLFFERRTKPRLFRLFLLPCAGLWISTVYLRYHYLVDLACGFALGALGLWLSRRRNGHRAERLRGRDRAVRELPATAQP